MADVAALLERLRLVEAQRDEEKKRADEQERLREEQTRLRENETRLREEETRLREEETRLREEQTRLREEETRLREAAEAQSMYIVSVPTLDALRTHSQVDPRRDALPPTPVDAPLRDRDRGEHQQETRQGDDPRVTAGFCPDPPSRRRPCTQAEPRAHAEHDLDGVQHDW